MSEEDKIHQELRAMRVGYASRLANRISTLETLWQELATPPDPSAIHKLLLGFHSLAGTSATYGFHEFSAAARQLELFFKTLDPSQVSDSVQVITFERLLQTLKQEEISLREGANRLDWNY